MVHSVIAERFELIRRIGVGGMGEVWEAHDVELDERVALKQLTLDGEPEAVRRMRDEVRLARRITHPNVVRIFDIGEDNGLHYLTMELIAGDNLRDRIAGRPLPYRRALGWASQIANGLDAAHAAGVIHRDLKPSNVLLAGDRAVVTDFGVARASQQQGVAGESSGTEQYMAPEQQDGGTEEVRTDLWAFGIMLFEMLHGQRPKSVLELPQTTEADALIRRCLSEDPGERPTAAEAARALNQTLDGGAKPGEPTGERSIAVLPPRVLGDGLDPTLVDALAYEMVDALQRTRGLKVVSVAAASAFANERDARKVGEALGVYAVADTTLQVRGKQLRIDARLIDARTGFQLWSERLEDELDGVLQLQEALAGRIAEQLRVTIDALANRGAAPAEIIGRYLRARAKLNRYDLFGPEGAVAELEAVTRDAKDLRAAHGALATARVRVWFQSREHLPEVEKLAAEAVQHSLEIAPDLPETHVAAAALAVHRAEYPQCVRSLYRALGAAPTCAPAHEMLALLEGESGRVEQALARASWVLDTDPTLLAARNLMVTRLLLLGRIDDAEHVRDEGLRRSLSLAQIYPSLLRIAIERRDFARLDELAAEVLRSAHPLREHLSALTRLSSGAAKPEEIRPLFAELIDGAPNASSRRHTLPCQMFADGAGVHGATPFVLEFLECAARHGLLDVFWLERSTPLDCARADPRFARVHEIVSQRARTMWLEAGEDAAAAVPG